MKITKISLPQAVKKSVLAFGGQTKNTICFASGNRASMSGAHADVTILHDRELFKKDVAYFLKKHPRVLACDMHPDYVSTKLAHESESVAGGTLIEVQHHHAHIVSCMADNNIGNTDVIGVAFDGTGFGEDGSLWGGEFFRCNYRAYDRLAHIAAVPLLGGTQAIRQPWRLTYVWLERALGKKMFQLPLKIVRNVPRRNWEVLCQMRARGMNAPSATSIGRLFDAAASLILDTPIATFEAELAIAIETCAYRSKKKPSVYPWAYSTDTKGMVVIDPTKVFTAIVRDLKAAKKKEDIALCFHETVAAIIEKTCCLLRRKTKVNLVALSGGVFQNTLLRARAVEVLQKKEFRVVAHRAVPCSDAGISLGQAVIAGFLR